MKRTRLFALILASVMVLSLLTACGGEKTQAKDVDLPELWASMEENLELPAMMELDDDALDFLYGMDAADLESYVGRIPLMNVHATEFFMAKVKDGKMDAVKEVLQNRQATLEQQWSQYLPDQYALVKNAKLIVNGNYVLFCISEDADTVADLFNDATA